MKKIFSKFGSRKFLTCVAGIILGICMAFGIDEGAVNIIAGAVTSIASAVIYIYTEGKIDAAAVEKVKDTVGQVTEAVDVIESIEE